MQKILIRVKGMQQQGGFTCVGCPEAVRQELAHLQGLVETHYLPEQDLFAVTFHPEVVKAEDILAAVWLAGKKQGREFIPEVIY